MHKPLIEASDIHVSGPNNEYVDAVLLGSTAAQYPLSTTTAAKMSPSTHTVKLRFTLHLDTSVAYQTRFLVEVWSQHELKWNEVWHLHRDVIKPPAGIVSHRPDVVAEAHLAYFQQVIDELFAKAREAMK